MIPASLRLFAIGLLTGLAVTTVALLTGLARASDSWVIDGIGFRTDSGAGEQPKTDDRV